MMRWLLVAGLVGCGQPTVQEPSAPIPVPAVIVEEPSLLEDVEPPPAPPTPEERAEAYREALAALQEEREKLAKQWRQASGEEARSAILDQAAREVADVLLTELFPPWFGTPWAFHGTSQQPGLGTIACGYFVSTLLRDAGFRVERVLLAQQPAEYIVQSLVPPAAIRRHRRKPVSDVVAAIEEQGTGLYIVGLDNHVGFIANDGQAVVMCHASYLVPPEVQCEEAVSAEAMVSGYHITGRLMERPMLTAWLKQTPLPTWVDGVSPVLSGE